MAERRARRPEKLLETLPVEPRLHVRGARGELDVRRAGKPLQIERDAALDGDGSSAHTAA